jgi:hypothetical protein
MSARSEHEHACVVGPEQPAPPDGPGGGLVHVRVWSEVAQSHGENGEKALSKGAVLRKRARRMRALSLTLSGGRGKTMSPLGVVMKRSSERHVRPSESTCEQRV